MTLEQLTEQLKAYCLLMPNLRSQTIYKLSIDMDGFLRINLDETTLSIPIT